MATKKLITYPFDRMDQYVYGERFVGRNSYVQQLQKYCTRNNIAIQGLPKIGKTSLVYHSLINEKDKVISPDGNPIVTVFFNVALFVDSDSLFSELVVQAKKRLDEVISDEEKIILQRQFDLSDGGVDKFKISSFFNTGLNEISVHLVIIFDEFDKIRKFFTGTDFSLLRSILDSPKTSGIITCRRSILSIENSCAFDDKGPSTFYQLFQGTNTIHLKQFNDSDISSYWLRLDAYCKEIGLNIDEPYKNAAKHHVNNHPNLLDVYNSLIYREYEIDKKLPSKVSLRTNMKSSFDSIIRVLDEEGLLNAAIQAVIGPVYDLTQDQLDHLLEYDFLRKTDPINKYKLLGTNIGFVGNDIDSEDDEEIAYIACSDYFTILMKNEFSSKIKFWDEWQSAFLGIRKVINIFLEINIGEDWESTATDTVITISGGKSLISVLSESKKKDTYENITPSPLLEYVDETVALDIITKYWANFSKVFVKHTDSDIKKKFNYLKKIRNHHAHLNAKFLSDTDKEKANKYLTEISEDLKTFFTKENYDDLKAIPLTEQIVSETTGYKKQGKLVDGDQNCYGQITIENSKVVVLFDGKLKVPVDSKEAPNFSENDNVIFDFHVQQGKNGRTFNVAKNVRKL